MASSLVKELEGVTATSIDTLNLKAQKALHSKSLIFEPRVASAQSFDTLYTLCYEGYQELCLLDARFLSFQQTLFSEQSQNEDRMLMNKDENAILDKKLEAFLGLVGGRLRLNPAIKAVEWLVRRFRIHEYNASFLLTTFLPYHTLPIFTTLLSILPANIPEHYFQFLHGHIRALVNPTRSDIVKAAIKQPLFASTFNTYVLRICAARQHYPALIAFWAGIMAEVTSGMLDNARSGRRGVQQQNEQDVLLRLLPTLNEGLAMKKVPDLRLGCYMLLIIMSAKGGLDDKLLEAMMEATVQGWTADTVGTALICLASLAQHRGSRGSKKLPRKVIKELLKVDNLSIQLIDLSKQHRIDKLVNGLCLGLVDRLNKRQETSGLPIIVHILENQVVNDKQAAFIFKSLLDVADKTEGSGETQEILHRQLATSLTSLAQLPGHVGSVMQETLNGTDLDLDDLELKLHMTIRQKQIDLPVEDTEMIDSQTAQGDLPAFADSFRELSTGTVSEKSFLTHDCPNIYHKLCEAFIASITSTSNLDLFDNAPILRKESAHEDTLYLSFYMRIWCAPLPVLARASALQMVTRYLKQYEGPEIDFQAVIPYVVAALHDPATKVRRAAAELVLQLAILYPENIKKKGSHPIIWGTKELYGQTIEAELAKIDVSMRLIREILLVDLDECVLDAKHIEALFQRALNAPRSSEPAPKDDKKRLPQTTRIAILSFLASHITCSPIFTVKLRLFQVLNVVRGVAGTTRTKFLLPPLRQWALLGPAEASKYCQDEKINQAEFDDQALMAVVANDDEGLNFLTTIISGNVALDRQSLLDAVFRRLRAIWPSLKGESQLRVAQVLMDSTQASPSDPSYHKIASEASEEILQTVPLTTDILLSFLSQLPTAAQLADKPSANKRRRTSHGEVARAQIEDSASMTAAIRKVTFVLQLVRSSEPGKHPELMKDLFNCLAELQHFKAQVGSELAFLQCLALGSLLEILKAYKTDRALKLTRSAVRADLLVDCVQKSVSGQVQNDALLLIATLADIAPELVLHSVMPIFTFMGSSVLRQNDEYSAYVIDRTVREVIPPLIASLRKEKGNVVVGASELLLSFVAAYEHVPPHRRTGLLTSLVETLGVEDFLFALLAMLVDKYGLNENIQAFAIELSSSFSPEVQLQSVVKHINLVSDVLKPKPTYSTVLLRANEEGVQDPYASAEAQLALLSPILSQKRLVSQTEKLLKHDDMDAARIRELYSTILENLLTLVDSVKGHELVYTQCGEVLESLLGLLSTSEFVKSVEGLLDRPNEPLRRKVLRSLQVRIEQENAADNVSRIAMLGFLPQLTAIIRESKDIVYKQTAVACVDKISEKYGKRDLDAVTAAAQTIASNECLGQSDHNLRIIALLCLSSLVEILREGIVSVLPSAIPKALEYMQESIEDKSGTIKLHNAGYAFFSALAHHLPYMVSGKYLDKLLTISNASAEAGLDKDSNESRIHCMQLASKQLDARTMFNALETNWSAACLAGTEAITEYLEVLSSAIDKHPKGLVTKYSPVLAKIFQNAFDLRRQWSVAPKDSLNPHSMTQIEGQVNQVAIKMIYKFNDATFRPIFSGLVEWAASTKPATERILRLQSIYGFMTLFFADLKSIVTSYATYFLDNAVIVLKSVDPKNPESVELWSRVLRTLVQCFEFDQDDFWQSPAHFDVMAPVLCEQFNHASTLPLLEEFVPAIVQLAAAADAAEHSKTLNGAILKHMRSENASIRLAAVQCQQALTERLGEDWLAMLPEMLPFISELQDDDDDMVERETQKWIVKIEGVLGESLDSMLQ